MFRYIKAAWYYPQGLVFVNFLIKAYGFSVIEKSSLFCLALNVTPAPYASIQNKHRQKFITNHKKLNKIPKNQNKVIKSPSLLPAH
jgi:hypothetical protein